MADQPRILIIGAGSRGNAYARAIVRATSAVIVGVCEPVKGKREEFGRRYIWGRGRGEKNGFGGEDREGDGEETRGEVAGTGEEEYGGGEVTMGSRYGAVGNTGPSDGQAFEDWRDFVIWELKRREKEKKHPQSENGEENEGTPQDPPPINAVLICVLDELHAEVLLGLAPLHLHIMCEKPLVRSIDEARDIWRAMKRIWGDGKTQRKIIAVGHVLRYSPHNMLLRKMLVEDRVLGEVMAVEHTEPVGWWHFTHSYVRGNWRKESTTAPSLLTKSCHDIDLLLWLLSTPPSSSPLPPHLPTSISSSGRLQFFRPRHKPTLAGPATNCLSCPAESACKYSAKKIYISPDAPYNGLRKQNTGWPVKVVVPEIEELVARDGWSGAEKVLLDRLGEDWDGKTSAKEREGKNWFGRCVFEADNDVCDEQVVTLTWDDDDDSSSSIHSPNLSPTHPPALPIPTTGHARSAKTAVFHMVAHTRKICQRYTHVYGTEGELYADSERITVRSFTKDEERVWVPEVPPGGHGGGDEGLVKGFVSAVRRVMALEREGRDIKKQEEDKEDKDGTLGFTIEAIQRDELGVDLAEIIRSHAVVWMAEEARREKKVVGFEEWWGREMSGAVNEMD